MLQSRWFLLCVSLICSFSSSSQIEPQFKFYLAFEDAKQEKDTVWFIMDTAATAGLDTIFGEDTVYLDSAKFQVFFGNSNTWYTKTQAQTPNNLYSLVNTQNEVYPITMRWDTNLLKNHSLPFKLRKAWGYNSRFHPNGLHFYDTLFLNSNNFGPIDSIVISDWGLLPLDVRFSKEPWKASDIEEIEPNQLIVAPVPCDDELAISSKSTLSNRVLRITNPKGQIVWNEKAYTDKFSIDTSNWPSGVYVITSNPAESIIRQKFIVQH